MGFLKFKNSKTLTLEKIPQGSFSINNDGKIISSTLPSSAPKCFLDEISMRVVATFKIARQQHFVLNEIVIKFATFRIVAKEMRNGFYVYISPAERT